jgi:ribonucleoside-triphosphate reductase
LFAVVKDCKTAQEFIDVINGDRNAIVCEGVTRIVGYYSRVNNWNKSKIGELRDRQKGQYGTGKHEKQYHKEALQAVDAL